MGDKWDEEFSVIGEKGEVGFIDYEDDKSVCSYNPSEEGPVIISVPFAFKDGKPQSVIVGETATDSITLKNTTDDPIQLWAVNIYASNPEDSFTVSLMEPPSANGRVEAIRGFLESFSLEDRMLQPGETLTVWVSCKPKDIGLHTSVLHFDVEDDRIERVIFLLAEDKITRSLTSRKPYMKNTRKKQFSVDEYVAGQRPARKTERPFRNRLPRYDIPKDVRDLIENKQVPEAIDEGLTIENYVSYFYTLLIMEEIQLEDDMRRYDMEHVTMKRRYEFLTLEVPGLAERRPSLVHGDFVFAKLATEDARDTPPYQGFIHHVQSEEVHLKFSSEFHLQHRDWKCYNLQFTYNRINMRRLYQAIDAVSGLDTRFLFLSESCERRLIEPTPIVPISNKLNEEQVSSVEMILGCKGAPPYLIHGPPGTGKTVTLVEAILQLYTTHKDARILVCAPSNSAADHLMEYLIGMKNVEIKEYEIFRLNAASRPYEDVKPDFIRFCFFAEQIFKCPPLNALRRYRIVISTYMSASLLYAEGVQRGHFSYMFLDEAGQASEPETMVPISTLCGRDTVVVLAGDPMQLGPVVHSKEAEKYGLGKSYMERLFECPFFCSGDQNYITTLIRNYRCHPEILSLPSTLFYEGQLLACREDSSSFASLAKRLPDIFPNSEFPILFFGIQGSDEREGNNPSWFNRFEISKVVDIIKKLTARGNLDDEDIGVITPYRQQVLKIKEVLESLEMSNIKVGSIEQFQGQERQVIIVSTVRSTIKHNEFDRTHCLGFLSNPKRFNVSVTRAISSLIIVGNPHIISEDLYWHRLLYKCSENSSYKGCPLPERQVCTFEDPAQEAAWNCQEEAYPRVSEVEWSQEAVPPANSKLVTEEAEFSDGWKM